MPSPILTQEMKKKRSTIHTKSCFCGASVTKRTKKKRKQLLKKVYNQIFVLNKPVEHNWMVKSFMGLQQKILKKYLYSAPKENHDVRKRAWVTLPLGSI